jgi:thiamine-phosphate pyrophosphorylase
MILPYTGYLNQPRSATPLLYYISDRRAFPGNQNQQKLRLLDKIAECTAAQVDYIQLREKDMSIRALEELANAASQLLAKGSRTKLLINSRTDVALACGAHGVHLPAHDLPASEVRVVFARSGNFHPMIGVSAHSFDELSYAESHGADFAVFGPVFAKGGEVATGGLERLAQACRRADRAMPVLAVGGVTLQNAKHCFAAGAEGVAAIRLFQENDVARLAAELRAKISC